MFTPCAKAYHTVDVKGDGWALGLVAYELLLGAYAWDTPTVEDSTWNEFNSPKRLSYVWLTCVPYCAVHDTYATFGLGLGLGLGLTCVPCRALHDLYATFPAFFFAVS